MRDNGLTLLPRPSPRLHSYGFPCLQATTASSVYGALGTSICTALTAPNSTAATAPWLTYPPPTGSTAAISAIAYSSTEDRMYFGDYVLMSIWSANMTGGDVRTHANFVFPVSSACTPTHRGQP